MKNGKLIYYYVASSLAILVPLPGRFAFGIMMMLLFNIQLIAVALLFHAVEHLNISLLRNSFITFALIAITVFFKQILTIICPVAALTLGFCIYLPALTTAIIEFFFLDYEKGIKTHIKNTLKKSLTMTAFVLIYFLLRDIIGYGTVTLPAWKKLLVFHLPYNLTGTSASMFFATIPGSLVFISVILCIYLVVYKKINIIRNSPAYLSEEGDKK